MGGILQHELWWICNKLPVGGGLGWVSVLRHARQTQSGTQQLELSVIPPLQVLKERLIVQIPHCVFLLRFCPVCAQQVGLDEAEELVFSAHTTLMLSSDNTAHQGQGLFSRILRNEKTENFWWWGMMQCKLWGGTAKKNNILTGDSYYFKVLCYFLVVPHYSCLSMCRIMAFNLYEIIRFNSVKTNASIYSIVLFN